jgi:hypothetical protein
LKTVLKGQLRSDLSLQPVRKSPALLEKRAFAEWQYLLVPQSANQLKGDPGVALLAAGKDFPGFERGFMHEPM